MERATSASKVHANFLVVAGSRYLNACLSPADSDGRGVSRGDTSHLSDTKSVVDLSRDLGSTFARASNLYLCPCRSLEPRRDTQSYELMRKQRSDDEMTGASSLGGMRKIADVSSIARCRGVDRPLTHSSKSATRRAGCARDSRLLFARQLSLGAILSSRFLRSIVASIVARSSPSSSRHKGGLSALETSHTKIKPAD